MLRHPDRPPARWRRTVASTTLLLIALAAAGCGITTIVPPPNTGPFIIVKHSATLSLQADQTGQATATCQAGEQLVSGGYASSYQNYFDNLGKSPVTEELLLDSYPST